MNVFITGASSGLGKSLAREYARRYPDCQLGLLARRSDLLEQLANSLAPVRTSIYPVDVLDRTALSGAASAFANQAGSVDVVIANAGISAGTSTGVDGHAAVFERIVNVNLRALFDTCDAFLPAMRVANRGSLVGIASVAGVRGMPGAGAYCASKAGALAYLESLRVELHSSQVKVITIAPGYVRTAMTAANPFPMPFLIDADVFARRAVDAIEAGRSLSIIPWQMAWVARLLRVLPNALFDRVFARTPRKPSALSD